MTSNLDTAVTDAMVEAALVAWFEEDGWRLGCSNEIIEQAEKSMRAALEAALSARVPALPQVGGEVEPAAFVDPRDLALLRQRNVHNVVLFADKQDDYMPLYTDPLAVDQAMREALRKIKEMLDTAFGAGVYDIGPVAPGMEGSRSHSQNGYAQAILEIASAALKQEGSK